MKTEATVKLNVDCHAHILAVDHGSRCLSDSLIQLAEAGRCGISLLLATPHFYPDQHRAEDFLYSRDRALRELSAAAPPDSPRILLGAEVLLCEGLQNLSQLEQMCLAGSRTLLVELPDLPWTSRYSHTLAALGRERGLQVLLAHPERYPSDLAEELFAAGYLGQLNAGSLLGLGRRPYMKWVQQGYIAALGSDNHGPAGSGYREFARAVRRLGNLARTLQESTTQLLLC